MTVEVVLPPIAIWEKSNGIFWATATSIAVPGTTVIDEIQALAHSLGSK